MRTPGMYPRVGSMEAREGVDIPEAFPAPWGPWVFTAPTLALRPDLETSLTACYSPDRSSRRRWRRFPRDSGACWAMSLPSSGPRRPRQWHFEPEQGGTERRHGIEKQVQLFYFPFNSPDPGLTTPDPPLACSPQPTPRSGELMPKAPPPSHPPHLPPGGGHQR